MPSLVMSLAWDLVPAAGDCTSVQVLARRILNNGEVKTHSLVSILYRENYHTQAKTAHLCKTLPLLKSQNEAASKT
jgi:hypothetical protein